MARVHATWVVGKKRTSGKRLRFTHYWEFPLFHTLFHLVIHLFNISFIHLSHNSLINLSYNYSFTQYFIHSFIINLFIHSCNIYSFVHHKCIHSFIHLFMQSVVCPSSVLIYYFIFIHSLVGITNTKLLYSSVFKQKQYQKV